MGRGGDPLEGWLPVLLRIQGMRALVLGGGSVGERRALQLASRGATVKVVALDFTERLINEARRGRLELFRVDLRNLDRLSKLIEWADLVVVATNDRRINEVAARIALRAGKLVNDATRAARGNVIVPFHAYMDGPDLLIAVTSMGRAGVAARLALDKCREVLASDRELKVVAATMARLKGWLKSVEEDPKKRLLVYYAVAEDEEYRRLAREGREEEALRRALEVARSLLGL